MHMGTSGLSIKNMSVLCKITRMHMGKSGQGIKLVVLLVPSIFM